MEDNSAGFTCKFIKIRTKPATERIPSKPTPTTSRDSIRYHCQYGPQDHSGKVKTLTMSMPPKQRRKVLLATSGLNRRSRKQGDAPAGGDLQVQGLKKSRGKKSKPTCTRKKKNLTTAGENNELTVAEGLQSLQLSTAKNINGNLRRSRTKHCPRAVQNSTPCTSNSTCTETHFLFDLNCRPEDVADDQTPLPPSTDSLTRTDSKKGKATKKEKTVPCKRTQRPKRPPKSMQHCTVVEDLNAVPLQLDFNVIPSENPAAAFQLPRNQIIRENSADAKVVLNRGPQAVQNDTNNSCQSTSRQKKPRDSLKKWGRSLKRGCLASFSVKTLLFLPHVSQICIYEGEHVNQDRVQCHGLLNAPDRSAFAWQLSPEIKEFVLTLLRSGLSISQIMAKHMAVVKEALRDKKELTRDMFLHERDVRNLATKVAKETYMLHTNDARSIQLWVQENPGSVFYYHETGATVEGGITPSNVPFTVGI